MRRIREILRLKYEAGATERAIARSIGVARSTVALTSLGARVAIGKSFA
jgi:DNA-binding transcriptional regulator LsrR (DeoR family)